MDLEAKRARHRRWRQRNAESERRRARRWRELNHAHVSDYNSNYYSRNKQRLDRLQAVRRRNRWNSDPEFKAKCKVHQKLHKKKRLLVDVGFLILERMRVRLVKALRGVISDLSTRELLGCSTDELRAWLQSQFRPGMTWDNYGNAPGKWQVDHRVPCASFNLRDPNQLRACFSYRNLQPLWYEENRRKGAKIAPEFNNVQTVTL